MRMSPQPHWFEGARTFTVGDDDLQRAVRTDVPVLISGGSASGREALARVIRSHGSRSRQAFTMVDCGSADLEAALANRVPGTTYLAEIDTLSADMQALLSRAIGTTDKDRIIAGTGKDLAGRDSFSQTLFYRLNVVHLVIEELQ